MYQCLFYLMAVSILANLVFRRKLGTFFSVFACAHLSLTEDRLTLTLTLEELSA